MVRADPSLLEAPPEPNPNTTLLPSQSSQDAPALKRSNSSDTVTTESDPIANQLDALIQSHQSRLNKSGGSETTGVTRTTSPWQEASQKQKLQEQEDELARTRKELDKARKERDEELQKLKQASLDLSKEKSSPAGQDPKEQAEQESHKAEDDLNKLQQSLDLVRVQTMTQIVREVNTTINEQRFVCKFIYLTNEQASKVTVDQMPQVRKALDCERKDVFEPKMVIRLMPSLFGKDYWEAFKTWAVKEPRKDEHGKETEQWDWGGRFPTKQVPELDHDEMVTTEHQLLLLVKEVLLPLALESHALIIGHEVCSLTAAFAKVSAPIVRQYGSKCPFRLLIFARAQFFTMRVNDPGTAAHMCYKVSPKWKRAVDRGVLKEAIKQRWGDDTYFWPHADLITGEYSMVLFECVTEQKLSSQAATRFQNTFIQSLSERLPVIAIQTYGTDKMEMVPAMADHAVRNGLPLFLLDSRLRGKLNEPQKGLLHEPAKWPEQVKRQRKLEAHLSGLPLGITKQEVLDGLQTVELFGPDSVEEVFGHDAEGREVGMPEDGHHVFSFVVRGLPSKVLERAPGVCCKLGEQRKMEVICVLAESNLRDTLTEKIQSALDAGLGFTPPHDDWWQIELRSFLEGCTRVNVGLGSLRTEERDETRAKILNSMREALPSVDPITGKRSASILFEKLLERIKEFVETAKGKVAEAMAGHKDSEQPSLARFMRGEEKLDVYDLRMAEEPSTFVRFKSVESVDDAVRCRSVKIRGNEVVVRRAPRTTGGEHGKKFHAFLDALSESLACHKHALHNKAGGGTFDFYTTSLIAYVKGEMLQAIEDSCPVICFRLRSCLCKAFETQDATESQHVRDRFIGQVQEGLEVALKTLEASVVDDMGRSVVVVGRWQPRRWQIELPYRGGPNRVNVSLDAAGEQRKQILSLLRRPASIPELRKQLEARITSFVKDVQKERLERAAKKTGRADSDIRSSSKSKAKEEAQLFDGANEVADLAFLEASEWKHGQKRKQEEMWLWEAIDDGRQQTKSQHQQGVGRTDHFEALVVSLVEEILSYHGEDLEWEVNQLSERFESAFAALKDCGTWTELNDTLNLRWAELRGKAFHKFNGARDLMKPTPAQPDSSKVIYTWRLNPKGNKNGEKVLRVSQSVLKERLAELAKDTKRVTDSGGQAAGHDPAKWAARRVVQQRLGSKSPTPLQVGRRNKFIPGDEEEEENPVMAVLEEWARDAYVYTDLDINSALSTEQFQAAIDSIERARAAVTSEPHWSRTALHSRFLEEGLVADFGAVYAKLRAYSQEGSAIANVQQDAAVAGKPRVYAAAQVVGALAELRRQFEAANQLLVYMGNEKKRDRHEVERFLTERGMRAEDVDAVMGHLLLVAKARVRHDNYEYSLEDLDFLERLDAALFADAKRQLLAKLDREKEASDNITRDRNNSVAMKANHELWMGIYDLLKSKDVHVANLHEIADVKDQISQHAQIQRLPKRNSQEALLLLRRAWVLVDLFVEHARFYKWMAKILQAISLVIGVVIVSLSVVQPVYPDTFDHDLCMRMMLGLSLTLSGITGATTIIDPSTKWMALRGTALALESEIWKFRTRVGEYRGLSNNISIYGRQEAERLAQQEFLARISTLQESLSKGSGLKDTSFYHNNTTTNDSEDEEEKPKREARNVRWYKRLTGQMPYRSLLEIADDSDAKAVEKPRRRRSWLRCCCRSPADRAPNAKTYRRSAKLKHGQYKSSRCMGDVKIKGAERDENSQEVRDNFHSPADTNRYLKFRLVPQILFYQKRIPRYSKFRRLFQIILLVASIVNALLAAINEPTWTAIVSALSGAFAAWQEFSNTGKKLERYSSAAHHLSNVLLWWQALPEMEQKVLTNVEDLVDRVETLLGGERAAWLSDAQQATKAAKGESGKDGEASGNGDTAKAALEDASKKANKSDSAKTVSK